MNGSKHAAISAAPGDHKGDSQPMVEVNSSSRLSEESREFVSNAANAVVLVLRTYGFDSQGYKLGPTLHHWYQCAAEMGDVLKFVKYKMAAYYASTLSRVTGEVQDLETPPFTCPDRPDVLLGGRAMRFLQQMERNNRELFISFLTSSMFLKKGMPRPTDAMVEKAVAKAAETLTTPVDAPFNMITDWFEYTQKSELQMLTAETVLETHRNITMFEEVIQTEKAKHKFHFNHALFKIAVDQSRELKTQALQLDQQLLRIKYDLTDRETFVDEMKKTVDEVFADVEFTQDDRSEPFMPSTSSNFEKSLQDGGTVGLIIERYGGQFDNWSKDLGIDNMETLLTMKEKHFDETSRGQKVSLSHVEVLDGKLRKMFGKLYETVVADALLEEPKVKPVGLKEALKIRCISKGPALTYMALKPLQKFMWKVLSKHVSARLIGQPVNADYLQEVLGKKLDDSQKYLSVDYSDATNQMYKWVSEELIVLISDKLNLSADERVLFKKGLVDHLIQMPDGTFKQQTRGQLMGSVVSFPLLCIVNMTILRMTKEYEMGRRLTCRQAGLAVNGDDGVIRTTPEGKAFWERLASFVGLKPSVGKVYYSSHFLNMNSRNFVRLDRPDMEVVTHPSVEKETIRVVNVDDVESVTVFSHELVLDETKTLETSYEKPHHFRLVPFVNLGLFLGVERSVGADTNSATSLNTIATRAKELLDVAPESIKEKLLQMYINQHLDELRKVKVPWFLPSHLGGLGLPIVRGTKFEPSSGDLRVGRLFYDTKRKVLETGVKIPSLPSAANWKLYAMAQHVARRAGFDFSEAGLSKQANSLEQITTINNKNKINISRSVRGMTSSARIVSMLVLVRLFQTKSLREIYFSDDDIKRHNERVRHNASRGGCSIEKATAFSFCEKKRMGLIQSKAESVEMYYGKLAIAINALRTNTKFPMGSVLALNLDSLPEAPKDLSDANIFPRQAFETLSIPTDNEHISIKPTFYPRCTNVVRKDDILVKKYNETVC